MKKLFSFIFAACMAVTAFAAEEVSTCPAGTLADGKVTHELECCTIVQEQGESTTALKSVSPWQAPAKSIMTITPKAGISIEQFSVNTKNTTLATYIGKTELTNATKTTTQGTVVTFVVTDPTQPVVLKFVSTTIKFAELTITYTGGTTTEPDPEQPADTTVTPTPEPEPEPEPQPTTETVYFINAQNWSGTIKAYAWTSSSNAAWPGVAMTKEAEQIGGKDVYSYTAAPGAYKNVIFNNGSTQTKDLVWQAGKYYVVNDWYTKDEAIAKLGAPIADTWTVVGASGLLGSNWSLTDEANDMTLQADGTYKLVKENLSLAAGSYEYKAAKNRGWDVAVPQSGNQTLKISKAGKYTVTFVLDKNATKLTATATIQEEVEVIPTVAIAGDMNEWSMNANLLTLAADKLTATATINLAEAKDYGFKVVLGGNWLSDGGAITREASSLVFTGANAEANTTLTADVAGDYTFTWTYATSTLVVTYPALAPDPEQPGDTTVTPEPVAETWTVVGAEGLMGTGWDLNNKENDMALQADGTYKLVKENLTLAVGNYEYKAAKDRGWDVAVPQQGNQTLTISKAGKYTVTFVLDITALTLTATPTLQEEVEVIPTVAIAGDMNGWNTSANLLVLAADKLTATATINLAEAKDYGFKVVLGGNWLSDGGAVTREAATLVFTGANTDANTTLTADVAGEYTFTWTYATNTLVVTYPAKSTVGFENIEATENAVKFIENGKLYIIREGNVYDATGARVK